jgi:hypothetical protein
VESDIVLGDAKMAKAVDQRLASPDDIWKRVRDFAQRAKEKRQPVFTVQERVRNFIT